MKYSEVKRILTAAGCYCDSQGANHEWWYSPITKRHFPVSRHKTEDAKGKTLKSISEQSGVKF